MFNLKLFLMKSKLFSFGFLLVGLSLFLLTSTFLFSCKKESVSTPKKIDYNLIGAEHNKGLDYVFNYVKENTAKDKSKFKTKADFLSLVEKGTQEFLENSDLLVNEKNIAIAIDEAKKPFTFYSSCINSGIKSTTLEKLWPDEVDNLLTDKQKEILSEMNDILNNNTDIQAIIEGLNKLEDKINSECSTEEKDVLLSATSIAKYSFQYWHDNFDTWMNEFGKEYNLTSGRKFSWSEVGKNDVAYGVGGGVAGAIVGGSVSLGILTLPGWAAGAIGGAVGGSIGNAILQIW